MNGGHTDYVTSLVCLKNGLLASGSYDSKIKIWNVTDGKLKYSFDQLNGGHTHLIWSLVILDNGLLASGSDDYSVKIWDIEKN